MLRQLLCGSALVALMACPAALPAQPHARQSQNQQQQNAQTKTVSGTVTAIGNDRKSFSMDVKDNNNNSSQTQKMQFYIDQKTQVQGRVGIGTKATVQYQPTNDGRNLAVNVMPQTGQ